MTKQDGPKDSREMSSRASRPALPEAVADATYLQMPVTDKQIPTVPQVLLSKSVHELLSFQEEESLRRCLDTDTVFTTGIEERILLCCAAGIGNIRDKTESKILKTLMQSSEKMAALAIGLRVIFESDPELSLSQSVAINYLSFLPVQLARDILHIAANNGLLTGSWYKDAFDESKSLEFALACQKMRQSLDPEQLLLRIDTDTCRTLTSILRGIDALVDGQTDAADATTHVSALTSLADSELRLSTLALLLFTQGDAPHIARDFLSEQQPRLTALLLDS